MADEAERERILRAIEERSEFVIGDDGFVVYWPDGLSGALNEWVLRLIADELERRNAPWAKKIGEQFDPPHSPSDKGARP